MLLLMASDTRSHLDSMAQSSWLAQPSSACAACLLQALQPHRQQLLLCQGSHALLLLTLLPLPLALQLSSCLARHQQSQAVEPA